jgi:hypothetical protein
MIQQKGERHKAEPKAKFSTIGGTVWVSVVGIDVSPIFEVDVTRVEVGWVSEPPGLTVEGNANIVGQVTVKEGYWSPLELEAGDYWLWSSNSGEVTIQACAADAIFNPVPVTFPSESAG